MIINSPKVLVNPCAMSVDRIEVSPCDTLRGALVVDVGSADGRKPMTVVKVYPASMVPGIGCGAFRLPDGNMLTNGESGAKGGDDFLYIFDTSRIGEGTFVKSWSPMSAAITMLPSGAGLAA